MKIRFTGSFLIFFLAFIGVSNAQDRGFCGLTDNTLLRERLIANKKALAASPVQTRSSVVKYVPLTFILVADANGNGRVREEQILDQLVSLNEAYAPQEMVYYIDEWRYKDHTLIFTDPTHASSAFQMKLIKDPNAMNVYITESAQTSGTSDGTTLGFYNIPNDWIVIRKDQINSATGVMSHEAGHFWSLGHTFDGWGCEAYDPDLHGNPVNIVWSPCDGSLRIELMNGSNCQTAGDLICDTNPDYNFGFGWSVSGDQCAPYTPEVHDSNGDLIDVIENNFMGYFLNCDDYFFSPIQQDIIETDYFSSDRSYLRSAYIPNQDPVENFVIYNYPINGEETSSFDNIDLDWEDVPGATDYLLIVARNAGFSLFPERYLVQESFFTLEELTPNVNYHWRVWPFNETQTGAGWGSTQTFRTGLSSAVETISSVDRIDVFPNPVTNTGEITVRIESSSAFDAKISLYDMTGEIAWYDATRRIEAGKETLIPINVERAIPGLYFVKIQSSEGGVISKKISIQ